MDPRSQTAIFASLTKTSLPGRVAGLIVTAGRGVTVGDATASGVPAPPGSRVGVDGTNSWIASQADEAPPIPAASTGTSALAIRAMTSRRVRNATIRWGCTSLMPNCGHHDDSSGTSPQSTHFDLLTAPGGPRRG